MYEKFYVRDIAAVNLSKIYFLKNAMKYVNQTTATYIAIEQQIFQQKNKSFVSDPNIKN